MSMTDEQIVKALECCAKNIRCDECPFKGIKNCMGELYIKSFDLIKRQQAEIEELKKGWQQDRFSRIGGGINGPKGTTCPCEE